MDRVPGPRPREPVYYRLKQRLLDTIESTEVGDRMPARVRLAHDTARRGRAWARGPGARRRDGFIREHGGGTYVLAAQARRAAGAVVVHVEARAQGYEPGRASCG